MKKLFTVLLCVCMILSVVPMTASIADGEQSQVMFDDVPDGTWYTDAVMWCRERGYMAGTSDNTFTPNGAMTRAMIVTVFAKVADVDLSSDEYGEVMFEDVDAGEWYTRPVCWAAKSGVTAGTGAGLFSPETTVTREQFMQMLYRLLQYIGVDTTYKGGNAFNAFGDKANVSDWAVDALKWAAENDLISGTGSANGAMYLSPLGTVTRAQAAVFLKSALEKNLGGEYPVGKITLGDADISEFTVVYGADFNVKMHEDMRKSAEFFVNAIKNACGVELAMYKDSELPAQEGAHEVLIGVTNREDAGLVSVDRSGLGEYAYLYEMQGNYLILTCPENKPGAGKAVTSFLEDVCGITYFGNHLITYDSKAEASIADGTRVEDTARFDNFANFTHGGDDQLLGSLSGDDAMLNLSHSLPLLGCPGCEYGDTPNSYHHLFHYSGSDPCLSNPDSIDTIIKNVRWIIENNKILSENKEAEAIVHVSQSDSAKFCKCDHCRAIYSVWGLGATYTQIMTYVSNALHDEYPNVKFMAYGCDETGKRPKLANEVSDEKYNAYLEKYGDLKYVPAKDITPPDNCILLLKSDDTCESHALDDPTCPRNADYVNNVKGWCEVYKTIYFNSFTGSKYYDHNIFPDVYELRETVRFFSQFENYKGFRYFAFGTSGSDLTGLHTFLISRLAWDVDISEADYSALINKYLKAAYGAGWSFVREYIDTVERLSDENHWWTYKGVGDRWNSVITAEQWRSDGNYEYCLGLLDRAAELCDTDEQLYAMTVAGVPIRYIGCCLAYDVYKSSQSDADLAAFSALSTEFYNYIKPLNVTQPENWTPTRDPEEWTD